MSEKKQEIEDRWEDFILANNNDDIESPQRRPGRQLMSSMDLDLSENASDALSDEEDYEDVSKGVKMINSVCSYLYHKIEKSTKLFSYFLHTRLLLKKNYILATRNKFQLIYLA